MRTTQTIKRTIRLILLGALCSFIVGAATAKSGAPVPNDPNLVKPLEVGQRVPAVTVRDAAGKPFDLLKAIRKKPTVLIFYRGGWCPYCNNQLGEIGAIETKLVGLGYQIIAISPDSPESIKKTKEKGYGHYLLLSDSDLDAARAYGLAFHVDDALVKKYKEEYKIDLEASCGRTHHMLPVPAAFVVGVNGKIEYRYYNPDYKVRVDSETLIDSAEKAID